MKNNHRNVNKLSQIIFLSQNYSAHKKMINQAKSRIDQSSPQKNKYHKKLLDQHSRYVSAVQKLKRNELHQKNMKISEKIIQASKPVSKEKIMNQNAKSVTSRSFWNLQTAKQRKRSQQQKLIQSLNQKMSQRISRSHSKQDFGLKSYKKNKTQIQIDLNIASQYSQRSKSVLQNLVYNNLKINPQDIPFLPQLSTRSRLQNLRKNNFKTQKSPKKPSTNPNSQNKSLI